MLLAVSSKSGASATAVGAAKLPTAAERARTMELKATILKVVENEDLGSKEVNV